MIDSEKNTKNNENDEISSFKTLVSYQNALIAEKDATIEELKSKLNDANDELNEIRNSFYWRLTGLPRKITGRLKLIIMKIPVAYKIAMGLKMLLSSTGRRRAASYIKRNFKRHKWNISRKTRRFESTYTFEKNIKFSILVPLYNTPKNFLKEMIDSVINQTYGNFELCLADGSTADFDDVGNYCKQRALKDDRIKYKKLENNGGISENTNACIEMACGDYIALFDHDDMLHPSALFEYMKAICEKNADFIYCDEDKFKKYKGKLYDAYYKPDFSPDTLRGNNYICHFTVFKKSLLEITGGFRKEFDGSQDHDLVLRLTEQAKSIVHVPKILYHWRVSDASVASDPYAKPYTITAGINAVSEHLERTGLKGTVESTTVHPNFYRIRYEITSNPLISIIIPNYNHITELSRCINSIITKSTYKNYEIIIVENNSNDATFAYYDTLKQYSQVKVVVYKPPKNEFNYSAINNFGVKYASGEQLLLLNNDIEVITPNWLEEMLMFSQRKDVGAVGAMLYYPNDSIQHAGVVVGVGGVAGHAFKYFKRGSFGYFGRNLIQHNVSAVTAACLMMPKKVYEEINGLDETFKVAFNDVDMCMRIRKAGYNIIFTPYAELYHYESISRGDEDTPKKQARFKSEVLRFQKRWEKELKNGDPYYNPNLSLKTENFSPK